MYLTVHNQNALASIVAAFRSCSLRSRAARAPASLSTVTINKFSTKPLDLWAPWFDGVWYKTFWGPNSSTAELIPSPDSFGTAAATHPMRTSVRTPFVRSSPASFWTSPKKPATTYRHRVPSGDFEGLSPGDGWCVCAARWLEAALAGAAAPVRLTATHQRALEVVPLQMLRTHAIDADN